MVRLLVIGIAAAALVGCSNPDPGAAENTARTNQSPSAGTLTPEKVEQMNPHPLPTGSSSSGSSSQTLPPAGG